MAPRKRAAARAAEPVAEPVVEPVVEPVIEPVADVPALVPGPAADAVLIFAPGLGRHQANSADRVAELVARTASRVREGTYVAEASVGTAPRGLRVVKTVLGPDRRPVLEVFELDYRDRLADKETERFGAPLGVLRAAYYAVASLLLTLRALRRGAKTKAAKAQLALGFLGTVSLFVVALLALGVVVGVLPEVAFVEKPAAAATGLTLAGAWAWARPKLLGVTAHLREAMRYQDDERHRATVTQTLDEAVDGLLDAGWEGRPIHVLGYSYGSLVLLDALLPPEPRTEDRLPGAVTSLVTIGCPADAVRLFYPDHFAGRVARVPALPWTNVYIAADVFGSNFRDGEDVAAEGGSDVAIGGQRPDVSRRYGSERLSFWNFVRFRGFSLHGGYWGGRDEASCFDLLVAGWVPAPEPA